MKQSRQLELYLELFEDISREQVEDTIATQLEIAFEQNTLGYRIINTLINDYFIRGPKRLEDSAKKVTFTKKLSMAEIHG